MNYYGIVNKIKSEHKSGIYGRKTLSKKELESFSFTDSFKKNYGLNNFFKLTFTAGLVGIAIDYFKFNKKLKRIEIQHPIESKDKTLIFTNNMLDNDYSIEEDLDLFYGLFDKFQFKENAIKRILTSQGGSTLTILEREFVPASMHHGGSNGKFDYGLYCEHPKNDKLIIPLEKATELIKSLILEETIKAYQFLGAKKMIIIERTLFSAELGGKNEGVELNSKLNSEKKVLREKIFGHGTFDPKRALENSFFIHDFPNIMTTIDGRIHGNQLLEKFSETINLSQGIDLGVLDLYTINANFNYQREWDFEIEFFDKSSDL